MVTKKKRLLVAGGGYADIPLIQSAKKLGYHVISSGNRPEELGHRHSDEYRQADFSDPEQMLDLAKQLRIDAVCACCNDFSALSAAYIAERMGLPGHDSFETSRIIHHKDLYRKFALSHGIPTPQAVGFGNIVDALNGLASLQFPIIVKPIDLTGGKGISRIDSADQARKALEMAFSASRAKRFVIEEFIHGTRHGFSAFLNNGRVVFSFSDNEHYFLNPYMVSAASTPSIVPVAVERKLSVLSERIASLLSLKMGIFHIQYILRGDDPIIIEICRRAPGDLYIKLVEYATGVEYSTWIVRAAAGLDCDGLRHRNPKGFFTRHCIMSAHGGTIARVVIDSEIEKNIVDRVMWWRRGDIVKDVLTSKYGIVFLEFGSNDEMLDKTMRMHELIRVETI